MGALLGGAALAVGGRYRLALAACILQQALVVGGQPRSTRLLTPPKRAMPAAQPPAPRLCRTVLHLAQGARRYLLSLPLTWSLLVLVLRLTPLNHSSVPSVW